MGMLLYIVIVATILALLQGIIVLIDGSGYVQNRVARRLKDISISDTTTEFLRRRMLGDVSPWLATVLSASPLRWIDGLILTSGVAVRTERIILTMTSAFPIGVLLLYFARLNPFTCVLGAGIIAFAFPIWLLYFIRRRRLNKIVSQLPEAIDVLVRSLRAGHPVPTGIRMIASEMPDPIKTEFRLVSDAMTYGLDLRAAMDRMEQRIPVPELRYMTAAVRIQYATGGNLGEILASLAGVMRDRRKLDLKVKALSAEARLSGKILSVIPFLIAGVIQFFNPTYYEEANTNTVLAYLLGFAILLVFAGIFALRRLAQIKV
jgi:tight adherence protein B